jgi:hypothetical protein
MQSATELMPKIGQEKTIVESTQRTFDQYTVDATQYFFARVKTIYGALKFEKMWPTDIDLKAAKKEWATNIGKHTKEELDLALTNAKKMIENDEKDFIWPNIGLILSGAKRFLNASHRATFKLPEPPEVTEAKRLKGLEELKKIKTLITKTD